VLILIGCLRWSARSGGLWPRRMKLTDFEALSFDCYGTLIDWEAGIAAVLEPWARDGGIDIGVEKLLEQYAKAEAHQEQQTPAALYPDILAAAMRSVGVALGAEVSQADGERLATSVGDWPAFPTRRLRWQRSPTRYRLVILSNVDRRSFAGSNARLGVRFDAIVTAEDVGSYKPSARNFAALQATVRGLGVPDGRLLHVAQSLFHDPRSREASRAADGVDRSPRSGEGLGRHAASERRRWHLTGPSVHGRVRGCGDNRLSIGLALAAAALWGSGDFLGGFANRATSLLSVLLISQGVGLVGMLVVATVIGGTPSGADLGYGALAGLAGLAGVAMLYRGLASGAMSLVAPITGVVAVVVPIVVGVGGGERPAVLQYAGIVVAVIAVALLSGGGTRSARLGPRHPAPRSRRRARLRSVLRGHRSDVDDRRSLAAGGCARCLGCRAPHGFGRNPSTPLIRRRQSHW